MIDFASKLSDRADQVQKLYPESSGLAPFFASYFLSCSDDQFSGLMDYLYLQHPVEHSMKQGTIKACYSNAFSATYGGEDPDLRYVEGVGLRIIGLQHAWICSDRSKAIDITWMDGKKSGAEQYLGFVFKRGALSDLINQGLMKTHGVFCDPKTFFAVVSDPARYLEQRP